MKLIQTLRRFARENKGVAALEFAIIAPLLMVPLLLGTVDLIDVMGANKRAQNAAASIADVVAAIPRFQTPNCRACGVRSTS